jgi:hypothetical protein
MRELRSETHAQGWDQLDLLPHEHGVGARQGQGQARPGGGGYLSGCTASESGQRGLKKIAKKFSANSDMDPRERALLDELAAMGLSRVMLQVAHAIGFDNFMAMWRILDTSYEAIADNDSGIYIRLQRMSAYRRYQRNRFIEAMAAMGLSHQEISRSVKRDLGEEVSDRHIWRLMEPGRVKP